LAADLAWEQVTAKSNFAVTQGRSQVQLGNEGKFKQAAP
jgi:hypothetical protein